MMPPRKGRLSPQVMDELMQFIDEQGAAGAGEASMPETEEGMGSTPAVEVEISGKPEPGEGGGQKVCPTCGHPY